MADALGLVLAEDAVCDLDSPPFDKALMDGFAVRTEDLVEGRGTLRVIDEVLAGQVPRQPVGPRQAIRIMTGAPIPDGADAVVPVEPTVRAAGSLRPVYGRRPTDQTAIPVRLSRIDWIYARSDWPELDVLT